MTGSEYGGQGVGLPAGTDRSEDGGGAPRPAGARHGGGSPPLCPTLASWAEGLEVGPMCVTVAMSGLAA